ncbi:phospholipase A [Vibrio sp. WJH972]
MRLLCLSLGALLISTNVVAETSLIDQRIKEEKKIQETRFSIIPHKPNYILPITYSDHLQDSKVYQDIYLNDESLQPLEITFQISFKIPLLTGVIDSPYSLFFGYTQNSYWQAYNTDNSSPFRETNYEPELFGTWAPDMELPNDWKFKVATLNLTHQSNGRTEPLSRSWNRIESSFAFEKDNLAVIVNPWVRIKEDSDDDDNADLLDFYGHGKVSLIYKHDDNTFTFTSRNNLESGFSKGSTELNWSFPVGGGIRGYLQVFSGYGNSLIEYNEYTNVVGVGISLTDWL